MSSSISCSVRYRLRSILVASTMLMIAVRLVLEIEFARDNLLAGVWRHRIDARQVGDLACWHSRGSCRLLLSTVTPGKIAHMLIDAGQLVKQRGLAAVLIAGERKCQRLSLRQRRLVRLDMVFAGLAQTRMLHLPRRLCRRTVFAPESDLCSAA